MQEEEKRPRLLKSSSPNGAFYYKYQPCLGPGLPTTGEDRQSLPQNKSRLYFNNFKRLDIASFSNRPFLIFIRLKKKIPVGSESHMFQIPSVLGSREQRGEKLCVGRSQHTKQAPRHRTNYAGEKEDIRLRGVPWEEAE